MVPSGHRGLEYRLAVLVVNDRLLSGLVSNISGFSAFS